MTYHYGRLHPIGERGTGHDVNTRASHRAADPECEARP
jgi:hypothetical protein